MLQNSWSMPSIWAAIWVVSFFNAALGVSLVTTHDAGGFCFFPNTPPHLYGNLVIFIPRTLCFIITIGLYCRLFFFFRRKSFNNTNSHFPSNFASGQAPSLVFLTSTGAEYSIDSTKPLPDHVGDEVGSLSELQIPVTRDSNRSSHSFQTKLAQYQSKWSRKSSKDSQATLVDTNSRWKMIQLPKLSPHRLPPEVSIQESAEENAPASAEARQSPLQGSRVISEDKNGFNRELSSLPVSPKSSPPLIAAEHSASYISENIPDLLASQEVGDAAPMSETSSYRFPQIPSSPAISLHQQVQAPINPINLAAIGFAHRTVLKSEISKSSSNVNGTVSQTRFSREQQAAEQLRSQSPCLESQLDEGSPLIEDNENSITGFWDALANIPPDQLKAPISADVPMPRRLSAAEEKRRVSYLMMLYPIAVSVHIPGLKLFETYALDLQYSFIVTISVGRTLAVLITHSPASPSLNVLNRVFVLSTGIVDAAIYTIVEWRFRAAPRAASR